jgi:hypothetical protein
VTNCDGRGRTRDVDVARRRSEVVQGIPFTTAERRSLFDASMYEDDDVHQEYDVAPDDQRFLMVRDRSVSEDAEPELVWVRNWLEELKAKMGGRG